MELLGLVAGTVAGGFVSAVLASLASFAFLVLVSLVPTYVALHRRCLRRAFGLFWVVLVADLGLVGMPPFGIALWLAALAYAFAPRRGKRTGRAVAA